ncbi:MAG TPA: hypothetical protein VHC97_04925 [Thermoanaerobaculia bacterium]|nr:hypothetical protein [Thermoanaerobaculia bacterium]
MELRVEQVSGSTFLTVGGSRWDLTGTTDPLSSHLEYRLIDEAIRRARGRWVLHAGAVETPGGTCLVIGESGAGKTSLTLWLWTSGLRLGTDDLCPISQGALAPEVFPRALHMDAEYSMRLVEKMPPRPAGYPQDYYPFPGGLEGEDAAPLPPVSRLIVLQRDSRPPRPETEAVPLSQSEAAHHLLGAAIRTPGFDFGRALEDMVRLASGCRAWRLSASTPEGAGERAVELLSSL